MPRRPLLIYPDPLLKRVADPCCAVDDEVRSIVADLADTMRAHERCVGLSAPQIGVSRRIIVVDVTSHPKAETSSGLIVIVDPVIVGAEGAEVGREGCLSLPNITANVRRATRISVEGRGAEGEKAKVDSAGFEARALQHEIDHLDGILILDRVTSPSEIFPRRS